MARAPFQVLVLPYRVVSASEVLYTIFKRESCTGGYWQGIAGGGQDDETPIDAAKREALEEAGVSRNSEYIKLESCVMIPVVEVCGFQWGEDVLVIPEYCFGVRVEDAALLLSSEHSEYRWCSYDDARSTVHWDSNRSALWELDHRIKKSGGRTQSA